MDRLVLSTFRGHLVIRHCCFDRPLPADQVINFRPVCVGDGTTAKFRPNQFSPIVLVGGPISR